MKKKMIKRALGTMVLAMMVLGWAEPSAAAALSANDLTDVRRAEDYMNGLTSLKARFLQVNNGGSTAEGTVWLSRPGKMRLEYDPPNPLLVVADGTFLIVHDAELDDPSYIPLESTPAGVMLRPKIALNSGDLKVTEVERDAGVISFKIINAEEPEQGDLTLTFTERPFLLRQWTVRDVQDKYTTVSLFDVQSGIEIDLKKFVFENPKFKQHQLPLR